MSRIVVLFAAAVCLAGLIACESGVQVGDAWLVRPSNRIAASRVRITSYELDAERRPANRQHLDVDLYTGQTSLEDSDGRMHPQQLSTPELDQLRSAVLDRSWLVSRKPARDPVGGVTWFEVTAYDGDTPVPGTGRWALPPLKPLPPSAMLLVESFNHADRLAHPLSRQVNLVP